MEQKHKTRTIHPTHRLTQVHVDLDDDDLCSFRTAPMNEQLGVAGEIASLLGGQGWRVSRLQSRVVDGRLAKSRARRWL